jgi:predicted membrane protein
MNLSAALAVFLFVVGIFLFVFISIVIGAVLIVVGVIVIYFGRRTAARLKQTESTSFPPPAPMTPVATGVSQQDMGKTKCKYCGTLNDLANASVCSKCGAHLN